MKSTLFRSIIVLLLAILLLDYAWSEKIVLHVAGWGGPRDREIWNYISKEFERLHPNIIVKPIHIPTNYKETVLTSIAGGAPPDVLLLDSVIIPAFVGKDLLVNLTPYAESLGIDLSMYYQNVLDIARFGDTLYAFPKGFTPLMMYYNKKLFDQADIPYPKDGWTWSDYLELARKLTRDTDGDGQIDQYGTMFGNEFYLIQPWIWANGGDILSPDGKQATGYLNSTKTEQAVQFLIDLRNKEKVVPAPEVAPDLGRQVTMFYTGKIAMMASGHWALVGLKEYIDKGKLDIGVVHLPRVPGERPVTVMYETGYAVPKAAKHRKEAVMLAAFLSGPIVQRKDVERGVEISSIKAIAEEVAAKDPYGVEKPFIREVINARQPWGTKVEKFSIVETIIREAIDEVMLGGKDIHQAFTEAATKIDEELASEVILKTKPGLSDKVRILGFVGTELIVALVLILLLIGRTSGMLRLRTKHAYMFVAPSLFFLLFFIIGPVLFSLYLSFHHWNIVEPSKPWVGLANFKALLHDRLFLRSLLNAGFYSLYVPISMAISLAVAVMMNQRIRGIAILRTLYFLPSICSFVAIAMVWKWIYNPQFGLANYMLGKIGLGPFSWLTSTSTAMPSIMLMSIWMSIGYQMVIFLAGLQGIPDYLYEAAVIDGANAWQKFWRITLPLLRPSIFFVLVTSIIGSFQVFGPIYVMTQGGPLHATDVVVYHIYKNAWDYLKMGYASAMSWILFAVILIVTLIQFRFFRHGLEYY